MISRSAIQRSCVILGLIGLSAFLFYIGKGHTLLLDTNAVTIDGKELRSAETVEVSIDGKEPESMGRAERVMVTVAGPRHRIAIEVISGGDKKVEGRLSIPTFLDTAVVSIPAILGGASPEHWVTPFVPARSEEAPAEKIQHQEPSSETPVSGTPPAGPSVPD